LLHGILKVVGSEAYMLVVWGENQKLCIPLTPTAISAVLFLGLS